MAKKKSTAKKTNTKTPRKSISFKLTRQQQIILGSFLFLLGLGLLFSFISYLFTWKVDQSLIATGTRDDEASNWLSLVGARISHFFIYKGFGIPALALCILTALTGIHYFFDYAKTSLKRFWFWGILLMLWLAVFLGFFHKKNDILGGTVGYEINDFLQDYLGLAGAIIVMAFLAIVYLVVRLKLTPERISTFINKQRSDLAGEFSEDGKEPIIVDNSSTYEAEEFLKGTKVEDETAFAKAETTTPPKPSTFEQNVQDLQPTLTKKEAEPSNVASK